ncbi:hypothetical protein C8F04DRAFT_1187131 [Mycena alexandri]|uniref:Uncharacterized protein n=1 Tax=Mycena alexandri TaxID=1745969 RepID=A0AAD6SL62_9AGAR|nr:hypothetical protein C8F04DRAFT_1187131 [Mycena alexandri]
MARGRRPLDAETKANNRKLSLQRYASKNKESLREAARGRMKQLRARNSEIVVSEGMTPQHVLRARACRAVYRERALLNKDGAEALDEHIQRPYMAKTQKRHEGRPPPRKLKPPTENQRRCRALRAMGLEEDNSDDSDEDVPEGMCGCDRTECQKTHRNETAKRRDWKDFELRYPADVIARM